MKQNYQPPYIDIVYVFPLDCITSSVIESIEDIVYDRMD